MTLDLILYRPEFFLIFGFFVLLWLGTGNLVTPVEEILIITSINTYVKNTSRITSTPAFEFKERAFSFPTTSLLWTKAKEGLRKTFTGLYRLSRLKRSQSLKGPAHVSSPLTLWAIVWCLLSFLSISFTPLHYVFLGGSFQKDSYAIGLRRILFLTRFLVFRVSFSWQKIAGINQSEYIYLALLALIGGYLLIMSTDLMSLYLCMELQSFSLVVLCGLNEKSAFSLEAAIKYFLLSAFRSCFTLLGIGFVYWELGETSLPNIEMLCKRTRTTPTLSTALGIWFISVGLLWKLAVAPLHFWVPDVYIGAWSSVSLWITLLPKIAVLGFWTRHWRNLWNIFFGYYLSLFRALSLIVGRIAPLRQKDIKRLLSYSSIGHIGLLLMPLCITASINRNNTEENVRVLWVYILLYVVINLGTWGLVLWPTYRPFSSFVSMYERKNEKTKTRPRNTNTIPNTRVAPQYLWDLKGLNKSSRRAAFRWAIFIRSFAGIPPAYSFLGKARILWQRINKKLYILVFIALIYTIIRSVYYLKVIKISYVDKSPSYRSYGKLCPLTAYIITLSASTILLGLWYGNSLFLRSHLLALSNFL